MNLLGNVGLLPGWAETRCARRVSQGALAVLRREQAARPELSGAALYAAVVAAYANIDPKDAAGIVRKAGESFADWPNWRDMTFRDVVSYVAIAEYMRSHPGRRGTNTNMRSVVAQIIPADL